MINKSDKRTIEYRGGTRGAVRAYDIKESEISYLGAKKILNMEQVEVADRYRKLFEQSTLSASGDNIAMIKYGVRIDGSTVPKGDPRLDAVQKLNYVHRVVGENYTSVLQKIVGEGFTLKQYSQIRAISPRKASRFLKEALHFAASQLGLAKTRHTIRA